MGDAEPNLVLIGLRGSGKSTLGARLAESLGRAFIDLDDVSAQQLGESSAGDAIANHGMDAFRRAEYEALESVLHEPNRVIALGGGTPTADGCDSLLASDACRVIYLKASPSTLQDRLSTSDNSDRPSLTGAGVVDEVSDVFAQRDPLYMDIAESVIHVDGVGEDSVLTALLALARAGI